MTTMKPSESVNNLTCRYIEIRQHPDRPDKMRGLKRAITVYSQKEQVPYPHVVRQIKRKLFNLGVQAQDL